MLADQKISPDPERKKGFSPELELILCASRKHPNEAAAARILELLQGKLNWSVVVSAAFQHHVAPLVYDNLRLTGGLTGEDLVPPEWLVCLRERTKETSALAMGLLSEMLRVAEVFEREPYLFLPYKGPVLSWLAYQDAAQRTFIDLDFVLEHKHIPRAASLFEGLGFHGDFGPEELQVGRGAPAPGQYGFTRQATQAQVELHTERTLRYLPVPLDFDEIGRRVITVQIAGKRIRTFSMEDTLLLLCVHGAKHFWDRLAWIADVAELITMQPVDWDRLTRIAAKMKCTRVFLLGVYLAHDLLGATLPKPVWEKARNDSRVRRLARLVCEQLEGRADATPGVLPRTMFRLRSSDGIGEGIRQLTRLTLTPTEHDRESVRLPGALAPLYVFVRPWRLWKEYGWGVRQQPRQDLGIYDSTPQNIVDQMLDLAEVQTDDVLYDLGCGDGRIVITAAERYGVRGVGVDISGERIAEAHANARRHGVEKLVKFLHQDAKSVDFSDATVITTYLTPEGVLKLRDRLQSSVQAGARIVSRNDRIYGLTPEKSEECVFPDGSRTSLYLWKGKGSVTNQVTKPHPNQGPGSGGD